MRCAALKVQAVRDRLVLPDAKISWVDAYQLMDAAIDSVSSVFPASGAA